MTLSNWAFVFFIMKKKNQNYAEMLKDPRWVQMSQEIKEWDRGVCQLCGNSEHLQVHHLCYEKIEMLGTTQDAR